MKVAAILWSNQAKSWQNVALKEGIELYTLTLKQCKSDPEEAMKIWQDMVSQSDVALIYHNGGEYDERMEKVTKQYAIPTIFLSSDPMIWTKSSLEPRIAAECYRYLMLGGEENAVSLCGYLKATILSEKIEIVPPKESAWEFGWHPKLGMFTDKELFWEALYARGFSSYVGILMSRSNVLANNTAVEEALIEMFESKGIGVAAVAYYPMKDEALGNLDGVEIIKHYFMHEQTVLIDALIKLSSFLLSNKRGDAKKGMLSPSDNLLSTLNIPIISPVISYYKSEAEWLENPEGLGSQVAFSIALPELEGGIEPLIIGANDESFQGNERGYKPIHDRIEKFSERVIRWLKLRKKPNHEKKVAFILNNNPCVGAESSVGGGAHLDTLESIASVLKQMKAEGYNVRVPENGKAIIDEILEKKALSEFRFTSVEEIVKCGGALDLLECDTYKQWFNLLPEHTKERIIESWGNPPGEKTNGIPPAMIYNGKIIISALDFGNAVILVQPKRGCAGPRCDGEVCLILHDPTVPPPHQYLATYQWLEKVYQADVLVHVGTHGNAEFLPGKSTGMSSGCYSDITVGNMPHLYIYNADNPAEGVIAKRRSYAVTVNHMQAVMEGAGLYGDLLELQKLIEEYERFEKSEPAKAHTLQHVIMSHKGITQLLGDTEKITHTNFHSKLKKIHGKLDELSGSYIPRGMHVFGENPQGEQRSAILHAMMRWDLHEKSLKGLIAQQKGIDTKTCELASLNAIDAIAKDAIYAWNQNQVPLQESLAFDDACIPLLKELEEELQHLSDSLDESDEIGSLLNGFNGGFIAPGPSGLITRGKTDILPTGRNLYSIDPYACPSRGAWEIGKLLAQGVIKKFQEESEGRYPKNVAFHWQSTDLMWTNGEMYAQLLYLIGCEPIWDQSGRVKKFRIMSLEELNRPRIDLTVRVSGITRDNFPNTIELLDEAIASVAALDEPEHLNFIKANTRLKEEQGLSFHSASARIFCSAPGTYQAGTNLAIYASAWKDEKDLSDIYLFWNSYAYGKNRFGERELESFKGSLKNVEATFNKTASDEYDLTGCCCYFGTHGGLINAAKTLRDGEEVKNYYGDTREQGRVGIRTLAEEMRRVTRSKLLNPKWIEGMQEHGYKGASEISKRVGRVYGWQATSKEVDGGIFDDIARSFLMDEHNKDFFEKNNPYALEEIGRRLLEAEARGLWKPSPDVGEELKERYLEVEGWLEERMGEGETQGGKIDMMSVEDVKGWKEKMKKVLG